MTLLLSTRECAVLALDQSSLNSFASAHNKYSNLAHNLLLKLEMAIVAG